MRRIVAYFGQSLPRIKRRRTLRSVPLTITNIFVHARSQSVQNAKQMLKINLFGKCERSLLSLTLSLTQWLLPTASTGPKSGRVGQGFQWETTNHVTRKARTTHTRMRSSSPRHQKIVLSSLRTKLKAQIAGLALGVSLISGSLFDVQLLVLPCTDYWTTQVHFGIFKHLNLNL